LLEEKGKVYTRFEASGPGALFQHDSSYRLWLPRTGEKQYLILTKDDYSRRVVGARIVQRKATFEHLQTVRGNVTIYEIPLAYYLDNHSIFRFVLHRGVHVRYKLQEDEGEIQSRKALSSLGIGMIYTGKRQAQTKGKVEKAFDYFRGGFPIFVKNTKSRRLLMPKRYWTISSAIIMTKGAMKRPRRYRPKDGKRPSRTGKAN
jgi:hypothetical protein